jgi:hypothetical protein
MPNESNAGFEPTKRVDSQESEELCAKTIHIHLDEDRADLTEPCRCLLDTGSEFDLVSERTLRNKRLSFARCEVSPVTGLGGFQILPIGSVLLKWHMDRKKQTTYHRTFLVISDDTPALFDVLIGKDWIVEHKAFCATLKSCWCASPAGIVLLFPRLALMKNEKLEGCTPGGRVVISDLRDGTS